MKNKTWIMMFGLATLSLGCGSASTEVDTTEQTDRNVPTEQTTPAPTPEKQFLSYPNLQMELFHAYGQDGLDFSVTLPDGKTVDNAHDQGDCYFFDKSGAGKLSQIVQCTTVQPGNFILKVTNKTGSYLNPELRLNLKKEFGDWTWGSGIVVNASETRTWTWDQLSLSQN